jgi:PhzF family phenazine biosynthesis protein
MKVKVHLINVFEKGELTGNKAGVCFLKEWLDDAHLQRIASEVNFSETAFVIEKEQPLIRYFSPETEVLFCGHASIAAAFMLFQKNTSTKEITLITSENKKVKTSIKNNKVMLEMPIESYLKEDLKVVDMAFSFSPDEVYNTRDNNDLLVVMENDLGNIQPNLSEIRKLHYRGIICSSKSKSELYDFEVRYFAPNLGIDEDAVTGSIYGALCNYWSKRLNKDQFTSIHKSSEGGVVESSIKQGNVLISGDISIIGEKYFHL